MNECRLLHSDISSSKKERRRKLFGFTLVTTVYKSSLTTSHFTLTTCTQPHVWCTQLCYVCDVDVVAYITTVYWLHFLETIELNQWWLMKILRGGEFESPPPHGKKVPLGFSNSGNLWIARKKIIDLTFFSKGGHSYRFPSRQGAFPQFSRGGDVPLVLQGENVPP